MAQLIDDDAAATLAFVTTTNAKDAGKTLTERAEWVGTRIGEVAKKAKITTVVFDRGERQYHGRVRALAEAARKAGLTF
jgi:large subunit ribosomal protein L18